MSWALGRLPGTDRLVEYESRLEEFVPGSKTLAVCQYDRRRFDAELLLDVIHTHPVVVVGTEVYAEVLDIILDATKSKHGIFGYVDDSGTLVCPSMTRSVWDQCEMPSKQLAFPREQWGASGVRP
jgi:hypothetical protein